MPRIKPVTSKDDLPAEHQGAAEAVLKIYGNLRGPWTMLLHSPKLAEKLVALTPFFWHESIIEGKLRSVGILAAVRERDADYVWAAQVGMARKNGVSEAMIDLLRARSDAGKFPTPEREIVTYVRQLLRDNRVEQPVFDTLKNRFGTQWLVELTATIGYFGLVSGIANAFEVAAPADGDKLPQR
ncbi:MAG TPA: carboxymuconolactone decarboxylase family protein [Burkholderiales bacterium]|jgi:4-carboxymuconolactone decarboxylase